uniref:non-specific serine/threonine protein kinase n=1 Tax=Acrobeloides nanus TaxID=290746 RepID=A0A914D2B2_9BILA
MVAKVFVPLDQSFSEEPYKEQIIKIRECLRDQPNCLAFSRVYKTARCSILTRPYHKDTLYDRLSTRPFLLDIEKRWIAFQMLKALGQCRIARVCHGDIKSQNILISSSNWVRLTDFASFKPAFLPYDNPSNFNFFFDTSRRRCCNLAPERFKKSEDLNYSSRLPSDTTSPSAELTESMDIFAMGCVLVELFTDGRRVPFSLGQLIDYKKMDDYQAKVYLEKVLTEIPDDLRELITIMLERNPKTRRERYEEFSPCTTKLFPPIFESFLYRFFKEFLITAQVSHSSYPKVRVQTQILPMEPDSVITKLYCERDNFFEKLSCDNFDSVLLIICLITSNIRACKTVNSKMDSITLLQKLSKITKPSIVVDRILPYLIHMLTDYFAQVRSEAIFVITEILSSLDSIPPDEYGIFIDYIFPRMKAITCDSSNLVRMALAVNIGQLATTSLRFLIESFKHIHDETGLLSDVQNDDEESKTSERELQLFERQALQESVSEIFVNLCGSDNEIRECLFSADSLTQLCEFFGSNRKTDVLMHMITLLNDKLDWRLRATFFENCPLVASQTSPVRNSKLKPFLQQGLQDTEEFIVLKTLSCIYKLCNMNCLEKATICDLCQFFVPFLIHPNKWLRLAVINILSVLNTIFSVADVYCRLMPLVNHYLKESLINFSDKLVLYQCLSEPIPRQIWKIITEQPNITQLLNEMENRRTIDKLGGGRNSLFSATATSSGSISSRLGGDRLGHSRKSSDIESTLKKLTNCGLTEHLEDKVISFKNILTKIDTSKQKQSSDKQNNRTDSRIYLEDYPKIHRRIFDLDKGVHRGAISKSNLNVMEESVEYREIFDVDAKDPSLRSNSRTPPLGLEPLPMNARSSRSPSQNYSLDSLQISSSRFILDEVLSHKRKKFLEQQRITQIGRQDAHRHGSLALASISNSSKPELRLVAHMHEHGEAIRRLAVHPNRSDFASCSADKTVKIWSVHPIKVDGPTAIQSKQTLGSSKH